MTMKDALGFVKQHGIATVIALILLYAVVLRSEAAHDRILDSINSQSNINGQVLMALERMVYLQRVQCQRDAGGDLVALRTCARDRE